MTIYEKAAQSPEELAELLHIICKDCSACPVVAECMYDSGDVLLTCVGRLLQYVNKEINNDRESMH